VFKRYAAAQALDKTVSRPLVGRAVVEDGGQQRHVQAQVQLKFPGECALTLELPERPATARTAGGRVTTEGANVPALEALAALGCPLATLKTVPAQQAEATLARMAKSLGVNTRVVSLRRINGRTAWVIGARALDESSPQMWFDKQTQRPVRVIASHGGATWD